jgi:hypothetical protein
MSFLFKADDKSVRIWRTRDWQEEKSITKPFQEVCKLNVYVIMYSKIFP